jgi:hypothetical protein
LEASSFGSHVVFRGGASVDDNSVDEAIGLISSLIDIPVGALFVLFFRP